MVLLFSGSTRRRELLELIGINPILYPVDIPEDSLPNEQPLNYLKRITLQKGNTGLVNWAKVMNNESSRILGIAGDTIVVSENRILQKPSTRDEAFEILISLSGKYHNVLSGLVLTGYKENKFFQFYEFDSTSILFKTLNRSEIYSYIDEYQPYDKAGSYGIQDNNSPVAKFKGSYSNVVGLPLRKLLQHHKLLVDYF